MTTIAAVVADLAEVAVARLHSSERRMSSLTRRRIEAYLRGPDCATLLDLLCQLDRTATGALADRRDAAELAEAFRREFQRAVRAETAEAAEFADELWRMVAQNVTPRAALLDAGQRIPIKVVGPDGPSRNAWRSPRTPPGWPRRARPGRWSARPWHGLAR